MLAVTLIFSEEEHRVTLVVILTLLCGSVNSPLSNQPGGKSQYPISKGGKHIRSEALSLPPLPRIPAALEMCAPSQHLRVCHSHARGAGPPLWPAGRRPPPLGAIVADSQTPIIRTFKVSFCSRLLVPPSLACSSPLFFHPHWAFKSSPQNFLLLFLERQLM